MGNQDLQIEQEKQEERRTGPETRRHVPRFFRNYDAETNPKPVKEGRKQYDRRTLPEDLSHSVRQNSLTKSEDKRTSKNVS